MLAIAEAYLGLPIAYDGPSINYTVADGREVSTRKWHRDWEDRRMLKVAIYLNDVDAEGGPFQMVKRTDADRSEVNGYRYDLASDGQMSARLGADFRDAIVSCEGAAGTVIFTDTAHFFHRGKPAVARTARPYSTATSAIVRVTRSFASDPACPAAISMVWRVT